MKHVAVPDRETPGRRRGRPPSAPAEPGEVQALDRALAILEELSGTDGLSLSDISRRLSLPTSTAHRLLATLGRRDFARYIPATGVWTVGSGLFRAGSAYLRVRKLPEIGWPVVHALNVEVNETVNLSVLDGRDVICVMQSESHHPVRAFFRVGGLLPTHASGAGKAMLSLCTQAEREAWLSELSLRRFTEHTHCDLADLHADLAAVSVRGYAIDNEEHAIGMRCVAAAITDEYRRPIGAISLSAPTIRLPVERLEELGKVVARAADELTRLYSGDTGRA
jgi:IclR family acetate operon transcriptional repressor